jgi:Flp pilus assembly protein CpaB
MAAAAIVLAAVAGIGVYMYASNADERAANDAGFVQALVATADIAKGTTGQEALQAGLVKFERVARNSVPPAIVTDENALQNRVAAGRIDAKQFITDQTFKDASDGAGGIFSEAIATDKLVAVTVNVDAQRGVANQIAPGDHVDIATTTQDVSGNPTTGYLLRDVKVLAVGSSTVLQQNAATGGAAGAPLEVSGLLTFEVTSDDALRVIQANSGGTGLYLVLLPPQASTTAGAATAASTN